MNRNFFQMAMLAYSLNCWLMLFNREEQDEVATLRHTTLATARLRFLFVAAKIWSHAGRTGVSYSDHYAEKGLFGSPMAAWTQLSGLANAAILAAFGQPVSYQQGAGHPFTVSGILDKRTDEERHAGGVYARLFVALSGFSTSPDHGDEVTVDGALYTVFEVLNDPAGGCWLSIREKV